MGATRGAMPSDLARMGIFTREECEPKKTHGAAETPQNSKASDANRVVHHRHAALGMRRPAKAESQGGRHATGDAADTWAGSSA
eukprot:Skav202508  [mRNA]  locus=scaffold1359:46985:47794:- [translate_table: standard]